MTLSIDLTQEEEIQITREAAKNGMKLQEWAKKQIIAPLPDSVAPTQSEKLKTLFDKWAQEDSQLAATMTPEEIAAEEVQWEEIHRNIANSRVQFRTLDLDLSDYD